MCIKILTSFLAVAVSLNFDINDWNIQVIFKFPKKHNFATITDVTF